jgi:hypothetical protein
MRHESNIQELYESLKQAMYENVKAAHHLNTADEVETEAHVK